MPPCASGEEMKLSEYTMPIMDVARVLGVSTNRVRQLDGELQPSTEHVYRRYKPSIVEREVRRRAAVRGAK